MGEATRKKSRTERFVTDHPWCCFCGGSVAAATVEHAPPKVFFINKQRLPTHEFPACLRCNNGSSQSDQLVAFVALTMAGAISRVDNQYLMKLARGVRNNHPQLFGEVIRGGREDHYSVNGILRPLVRLRVPPDLRRGWLEPWAAKQAYALWYLYQKTILSPAATVEVKWAFNGNVWSGDFPRELFAILPGVGSLVAGSKNSRDSYFYKYFFDSEGGGAYICLVLYGCAMVILTVHTDGEAESDGRWTRFRTNAELGIHLD